MFNQTNIKAVVLDLDGTLLTSSKVVSKRNKNALTRLNDAGIPIIIATARPPRTVNHLLPDHLLEQSIIVYYNGALITSDRLQLNEHYYIDESINNEIIDYLIEFENDHHYSIEVNDEWFCYTNTDYRSMMSVKKNPLRISLEEIKVKKPTKILISNICDVETLIRKFGEKVNIIRTDSNQLIQIMKLNISKGYAVKRITEKMGISLDRTMVFGDDTNDLELFQTCGIPIAMGNAIEELKKIAVEITTSNDNDGVAHILENLMIGQPIET